MKKLIFLLPIIFLLGGCAGHPAGKRSIESLSAGTGAAMSSYATKSTVVDADKTLISDSAASNATKQAAMSTIKDYVLSDVLDFSATSPLNFNSTTGVLSLTPWASQSALETWLGWTFSGSGGGITVSSELPMVAGSAALNDTTHVLTVASDTRYTQFTGTFTAWDTTPSAFGFGTITGAVAGNEYCWTTPVTVAGINKAATITSTADSYKINGTTSTATSISLGDTFTPCLIASSTAGSTVSGNMTVGGVAGDPVFSVVTEEESTCSGSTTDYVGNTATTGTDSDQAVSTVRIRMYTPTCQTSGCSGDTTLTANVYHVSTTTSNAKVCAWEDNGDGLANESDVLVGCASVSSSIDGIASSVFNGELSCGVNYWIGTVSTDSSVWKGKYSTITGTTYSQTIAGAYNSPPNTLSGTWATIGTNRAYLAYISIGE